MASQNIRKSNSYEEEGRKLIHQFSQKLMSEQCNANEVDKKLSTLSFRDKGIGVGFGSIKHWLKMDNPALHNQLFTSVEILEMTTSGGGQHLDPAEGVSSLFPRQSVRVTTPRTSASSDSQAQFGSVRTIMLACTNSPSQSTCTMTVSQRFGHKFGPNGLQGWSVLTYLTRSFRAANHKTC